MKLYGKELDKELAKRKQIKEQRRDNKITLREAARSNSLGLTPSEYLEFENGSDVCSHEEYEKSIGGIHPPFLLMEICKKCGHANILARIKSKKDFDKYENELAEAFENSKRSMSERKEI